MITQYFGVSNKGMEWKADHGTRNSLLSTKSFAQYFRVRAIWNINVQATKEGYCYKLQLSNSNLISSVSFFGYEGIGDMETTEGTWNFLSSIIYLPRLPFPSLQLRFVISIYMFSLRLIYHSYDNFSEELRRKKKKGILAWAKNGIKTFCLPISESLNTIIT